MTGKKNLIYLNEEIDKYIKKKYYFISNQEIIQNIVIEKNNEISTYLEKNNINISEIEDIQKLLNTPIYNIAYNNFKNIIHKKEEKKNKLENVSYSNAYKCYKCGNNKTSVVYVQTRSCDEPMTAFVKCIKCQNQFIK